MLAKAIAFGATSVYSQRMVRNLGRSAEKRFSTLCSDLGVTCNPAIEDDHGWDHVVQFPHETVVGVSADMQPRLPAVFVQTKSHEADGLTVTMKLSNAVKFATSPNPCFVALATLPADSDVATWHAVHVWGELLERILRRAREESRDGTSEADINKKTFSFTMTGADLHHGQSILPWIAETVRRIGTNYAAAKTAIVPPPSLVGAIKIGPLSSIDELIDHTIGLTSDIPVQGFEMGARRLDVDIPLPLPVQGGGTYRASMQAHPVATADIRMRGPDGNVVDLVADVIVPPNLGLTAESYRYRFRAANLDIVWSPSGAATIRGHFDEQERTSPQELKKTLSFVRWAGKGDIDVRVTIEDEVTLGATARDRSPPRPGSSRRHSGTRSPARARLAASQDEDSHDINRRCRTGPADRGLPPLHERNGNAIGRRPPRSDGGSGLHRRRRIRCCTGR